MTVPKPVIPSHVAHVKAALLATLNGAEAKAISPKRPAVLAELARIRDEVDHLPDN